MSDVSDTEESVSSSDGGGKWPVNKNYINEILKKLHACRADDNDKIKIHEFNIKSACQNGVSNLSELLAVHVVYEHDDTTVKETLNLIIKLLPNDPFSRYFVTEAQFDYREIKFYTKILPDLLEFQENHLKPNVKPMKIAVPKCFHTQYIAGKLPTNDTESPEAPDSILVLEDMRPFGYKVAHFIKGLNLCETESAIKAIAVVHALSLGLKYKGKINLNEKYPATDSYQQLVEQGLPQLSKFLESIKGHERELNALTNIRSKTRSIIEYLLQPVEPMALITHTDFWCNNLLIKDSIRKNNVVSDDNCDNDGDDDGDDNCIILDWQMVTCSRPTNDIALLIMSSLSSTLRREYTEKLLDLYYTELKFNLDKINVDLENDLKYSRDKIANDYKQSQLLALLLCIGSVDIALGNKDAEQRFLDVLSDLYEDGILNVDELSF